MTITGRLPRAARLVLPGTVAGILAAGVLVGGPAVQAGQVVQVVRAVQAVEVADEVPDLHLVTLAGPGTSGTVGTGTPDARSVLIARQDQVLATIGSPATTYRWTTALNGFAAELTDDQVSALEDNDEVVEVEPNTIRPMAGRSTRSAARLSRPPAASTSATGGAGVVIGFVDSGIAPASPLFTDARGLGPTPEGFDGACLPGDDWPASRCNSKVVAAGWWVEGFGADRIRSSESLSALDVAGHGTQVASVAAGNSDVSVLVNGRRVSSFSGIAPRAKVAPYKACWAAPDPADDGCSTADLVSAIDQATADGVDVLNLAVAGPTTTDTVERALLGAAEADIVVVGAAGNTARSSFAAHATPWVTTVGAARGTTLRGRLSVVGGPVLTGASRSRRSLGPVRLVLGADVAASTARPADARRCLPGSLDAAEVADRAVVCLRGGTGRVDKSEAVALADGVAMVLVNDRPGAVIDDFHTVPTIQLTAPDGARLVRWVRRHDRTAVRLAGLGAEREASRPARWSAPGDGRATLLKPDVVALGEGVLGAVPGSWEVFSGTSAATARVSGVAALLRSRHDWSAPVVRSVLATTTRPLAGTSTLTQGSGRVGTSPPRPGLALEVVTSRYRRALDDLSWRGLNTSSVIMQGPGTTTRRVTNLGPRAEYFSARSLGFARHRVRTTPVALRLAPGESAVVRITVTGGARIGRFDDGWVVWRGARGSLTRIPVAIGR